MTHFNCTGSYALPQMAAKVAPGKRIATYKSLYRPLSSSEGGVAILSPIIQSAAHLATINTPSSRIAAGYLCIPLAAVSLALLSRFRGFLMKVKAAALSPVLVT